MKKLLTLAAAGLLGLAGYAQTDGEVTLFPEDRSGWTISGCSEANSWGDGGFDEIMDGNPATYWHSNYNASADPYTTVCPHYFVIDRGESEISTNASSNPLWGFTYLPRSGKENGTVVTYRLFILDDITGLNTVHNTETSVNVADDHASLTTFIAGKTPVVENGTFDYSAELLQTVEFTEAKKGRYVLFVVDSSTPDAQNRFASCAEFNLLRKEIVWNVTYTFPEYCGINMTMNVTLADGSNAAEHIPAVDFFTPTGLSVSGDAAIVNGQQKNFTVNGTWNIPMEFEKVYRVKLNPNAAKNVKYNEADGFSKTRYTDATGEELAAEYLWYFKYNDLTNGVLKVTMHSLKAEDSKGITIGTADDSKATLTDAPTTFIVRPTRWGSRLEGDFCLKHSTENNWINERNPNFSTWNNSDAENVSGSAIRLSSLSESDFELLSITNTAEAVAAAKENPTQQNIRALFVNYDFEGCSMIKNADAFAALGIAPSEAVNTWNTFRASIVNGEAFTAEQSESILPAYQALVSSSANTTGAHIKLAPNIAPGDLMMGRFNNGATFGVLGSDVNGNKTTWTLKPATGGFYLYNEYLAQYIQMPTEGLHTSAPAIPVASESEASVFVIDIFDAATARYGIKHVGTTDGYPYLHTNGSHALVRWAAQANSSWYLQASDEAAANNEANIGADDDLADASANCQIVGDGVGQYTAEPAPSEAYLSACEQFLAITAASSNAEKHAAAAAVRAAYSDTPTYTINMPQTGRFYRFRCAGGQKMFMSGIHQGHNIKMVAENEQPNKVETIFYLDANNHLVALCDGLCVGKFTSGDNNDNGSWTTLLSTNAKVGEVAFTASPAYGQFILSASSGRNLYGLNETVNVGGGTDPGYRWIISQVDWLPIPGSDKQYTAFYSPVVLKNKAADKMRANSVAVSLADATATTSAITGDVPANTPVLIEFTSEMERDASNGLVYLEIDYNAAAAQAETAAADTHFAGGIYATAKAEGTSYFTTQQQGEAVNFYALSDANVPGFASHIEVPTDQAAESYTISDPTALAIEELDVDSKAGADVIYDLQGRRVSKAGRGLYIINGKKVLVR